MDIQMDTSILEQIKAFQAKFPGQIDEVVRVTSNETLNEITKETPVKTGNLRRKWLLKRVSDSVYEIYNKVKYAPHVEWGTKAHDIEGNPLLKFKTKDGWRSAKKVHHPGTTGKKMMQNAIPGAQEKLKLNVAKKIKELWDAVKSFKKGY